MSEVYRKLQTCLESVRARTSFQPEVALILGSGLGDYADEIDIEETLEYTAIEGFPTSTVAGHKGRFVFGRVQGVPVVIMQGRVHYYEGYSMQDVVLPTRLMGLMGAKKLVLTNAAGGINPGFPLPTVEGHAGAFVFGTCRGRSLAALRGRIHYYERYTQQELTLPVRVMARLGVKTVILTNAAGGVNLDYKPGTLMLISDHINFSGNNPLMGPNLDQFGPRFPDMSEVYSRRMRSIVKETAAELDIPLHEGVYVQLTGPAYETPAEIRMCRAWGGDAVGMSTACEALAAKHMGLEVCGISCITNLAAGMSGKPLDHKEVQETADRVAVQFKRLIGEIIGRL